MKAVDPRWFKANFDYLRKIKSDVANLPDEKNVKMR